MLSDVSDDTPKLGEIRTVETKTEQWVHVLCGYGQWCYWASGVLHTVVVDTIFNRQAAHFAGFLQETYHGEKPEDRWMVVDGWGVPRPERRLYVEDEDEGLPRMERR